MKLILVILMVFVIPGPSSAEEPYSFDLSEIEVEMEKSPYHVGGYLELAPRLFWLDRDAALYRIHLYDRLKSDHLKKCDLKLSANAGYRKGISEFYLRAQVNKTRSDIKSRTEVALDEGYFSLQPSSNLNISIGKKVLKWGKGYAWNPVAFAGRTKDPDDPDLALEGFVLASADFIKSFSGPLRTLSLTPVIIPVRDHLNRDFGLRNGINYAGKLYLLFLDTDIDFMFLKGSTKASRFGMDFSRNITSNFEIHGEFAYIDDMTRTTVDGTGQKTPSNFDAKSYLFGIRYLTEGDTTFICEYYRNGTGFTERQMGGFFDFVDNSLDGYISTNDKTLLEGAKKMAEGGYGRPNPMKNYMYLRMTQKDPLDILYLSPSITWIYNMDDHSYSLSPELIYTGFTNLELRLKAGLIVGSDNSEFGEKPHDYRIELRARYYFDAAKWFH